MMDRLEEMMTESNTKVLEFCQPTNKRNEHNNWNILKMNVMKDTTKWMKYSTRRKERY